MMEVKCVVMGLILMHPAAVFAGIGSPDKQDYLAEARATMATGDKLAIGKSELSISRIDTLISEDHSVKGCRRVLLEEYLAGPRKHFFLEGQFSLPQPSLEKIGLVSRLVQDGKEIMASSATIDPTLTTNTLALGSIDMDDARFSGMYYVYCQTTGQEQVKLDAITIYSH